MSKKEILLLIKQLMYRVNTKTDDQYIQRVTSLIYDEAQEMIIEIPNSELLEDLSHQEQEARE